MQPEDYAEHIRRVDESAPPLTEAQRAKLAQLLKPEPAQPGIAAPREAA